jgi:hypothetical protein
LRAICISAPAGGLNAPTMTNRTISTICRRQCIAALLRFPKLLELEAPFLGEHNG